MQTLLFDANLCLPVSTQNHCNPPPAVMPLIVANKVGPAAAGAVLAPTLHDTGVYCR